MATATETAQQSTSSATSPKSTLGLADHGRVMTLEEYEACGFEEGWRYELARGVVIVTDVPNLPHGFIVERVSDLFAFYKRDHPEVVRYRAAGNDCRLRLPGMQSDRHPDQTIYLTPPPRERGREVWHYWVPAIVVEVVSEGGDDRDYVDKREEYLRAGILEYWILDPRLRRLLVLRRAGDIWQEVLVPVGQTYETHLLPGLVVDPSALLGPEENAEDE